MSAPTVLPARGEPHMSRSIRIYERLLVVYPRSFRDDYGADMVQLFGDLVSRMEDGRARSVWPRVLADLVTSGARERSAEWRSPERRPSTPLLVGILLLVGVSAVVGGPHLLPFGLLGRFPLVAIVLFVLPALGAAFVRRAWVSRRVLGGRPWIPAMIGAAFLVPGVWWALVTDDSGYWVVVASILALIYGLALGAIAAIATFVRSRRSSIPGHRRTRAIVMVTVAVVVLGAMAGAGFNSYLKSRPPAGDHSPANASVESRALWDAAYEGDIETVTAMIAACADPFVHFDDGGRARSNAEYWAGVNHSGRDPVGEPMLSRYLGIVELLHAAEDTWTERCNS